MATGLRRDVVYIQYIFSLTFQEKLRRRLAQIIALYHRYGISTDPFFFSRYLQDLIKERGLRTPNN